MLLVLLRVDLHYCSRHWPCLNGGTCINSGVGYRCVCDANFTGASCESYVHCTPTHTCYNDRFCNVSCFVNRTVFSARCNIFISRLCYDISVRLSVRLSVTEVHWRIIANLGFKFRSQFTTHCGRGACGRTVGCDHNAR